MMILDDFRPNRVALNEWKLEAQQFSPIWAMIKYTSDFLVIITIIY